MTLIETFGASLHVDPYIFSLLLPGKIIEHFCDEDKKSHYLDNLTPYERGLYFRYGIEALIKEKVI